MGGSELWNFALDDPLAWPLGRFCAESGYLFENDWTFQNNPNCWADVLHPELFPFTAYLSSVAKTYPTATKVLQRDVTLRNYNVPPGKNWEVRITDNDDEYTPKINVAKRNETTGWAEDNGQVHDFVISIFEPFRTLTKRFCYQYLEPDLCAKNKYKFYFLP